MILSIETATKNCSVALHYQGVLVASHELSQERSHSSMLSVMIDHLFKVTSIEKTDIDAVAISSGPGSYTGLRIGTATAKGICYALNIPLISIDTLTSMALQVSVYQKETWLCPMLDARRQEVYCALFDQDLKQIIEIKALVLTPESFAATLSDYKVSFFGSGAHKFKTMMIPNDNAIFVEGISPNAKDIGKYAWDKYSKSQFEDLAGFEPLYLKEFQKIKPKEL